jgi:AAA family ATP:ADP antiporter
MDRNEIRVAALMAGAAFFTLAGYEAIRSASTVLFKNAYGAENLPLVMAAMPFVVFAGVAGYGRLLTTLGPRRTLVVTSLGSGLLIFACYLLVLAGSKPVTPVLYLLKEFYIVLLIEQYWSYINSSLSSGTARKLNGPITGIAGLGSVAGGFITGISAKALGTDAMLLLAAFSLVPAALVSNLTYKLHGEPRQPDQSADETQRNPAGHMGLGLFRKNPVLAYLLAIVFVSQFMSAALDLRFQGLLSIDFAGRQDEETAFQGFFFSALSTAALVLQFVLAPLMLSFISLRLIHIMMPLIHVTTIGVAIVAPSVWTVGAALFFFKAFDYSIFRAAKEVLYIPFSFDIRYRAKEVIDVFGYRAGKGISAIGIVALQRAGVAMGAWYLPVAMAGAVLWLALIFPLTSDAPATRED